MRSRTTATAGVAAAGAAAALGIVAWSLFERVSAPLEIESGYVLSVPRSLPTVELVDESGAPFRAADFAGRWSFLYFGYTYCPDVCPLTLVELAKVKDLLAADAPASSTRFYLVSVDPKRDTPLRLREYVAYFDPELRGLSGSARALAELAKATETLYDVPEGEPGENYLVSHSSNVVLLDPAGRVYAVFTPPHDPARLAADFTKVAARYVEQR